MYPEEAQIIEPDIAEYIMDGQKVELSRKDFELSKKESELSRREFELFRKESELSRKELELTRKEAEICKRDADFAAQKAENGMLRKLLMQYRIKEESQGSICLEYKPDNYARLG